MATKCDSRQNVQDMKRKNDRREGNPQANWANIKITSTKKIMYKFRKYIAHNPSVKIIQRNAFYMEY